MSHSTLRAKRATIYIYILNVKKLIKKAKKKMKRDIFGDFQTLWVAFYSQQYRKNNALQIKFLLLLTFLLEENEGE